MGGTIKMLNTIQWIESNSVKSRLVALSLGRLYEEEPVGTMVLASTPGNFNSAKVIHSASYNQVLYIADHSDTTSQSSGTYQPKKFDPATSAVSNWTATDGTIPYGCPCICEWRGRIVLGGGTTNPHLVAASRQGDPGDWDFAETDVGAAWTMATADGGLFGDTVTALIPHNDDCLIVGCSTSLWVFRGDPGFQGSKDNLSRNFGIVDKGAWCVTPDGLALFLSHDGLKAVPAECGGAGDVLDISRAKLPEELLNVDRTTTAVSMAYDTRDRGVHIFVTPITEGASSATHWWFDWETKSFWKVTLGDPDYEPFCVHSRVNFTASSQAHSLVMLGCRDGYIRHFRNNVSEDDGTDFSSYVWIGPIGDATLMNDTLLTEIMGTLAKYSGKVTWSVHVGDTPEDAFAASAVEDGVWVAGRNNAAHPRARGQSVYVKLSNFDDDAWAFESAYAIIARGGRTRP